MNPSTAPKERVRIFNRAGVELAQFRAAVSRSWVIGGEGRATMTLASRKTEYVNDLVLRSGNWLLVENDTLPEWVGVIDLPREWSARQVTVNAFSPERVFAQRIGPLEETVKGPAGALFADLIKRVNKTELTLIRPGNIWTGGPVQENILHPYLLSQALSTIQKLSLEEYAWRPVITYNGILNVYADWFYQLGTQVSAPLIEGKAGGNIENGGAEMVEDGTICNSIFGYGPGTTWASRPSKTNYSQNNSVERAGLRQTSKDYGYISALDVIEKSNIAYLRKNSYPTRNFNVTALNRGDTFKFMQLGNRLPLSLQSVGFTGDSIGIETNVRILGMYYNPIDGQKIKLVLQELL